MAAAAAAAVARQCYSIMCTTNRDELYMLQRSRGLYNVRLIYFFNSLSLSLTLSISFALRLSVCLSLSRSPCAPLRLNAIHHVMLLTGVQV